MAIISLLFATFLFSLFGVFTRVISSSMGVFYQLCARIIIMVFLFFIIGVVSKSFTSIKKRDYFMFIFRGFLIIADFASFIVAVNNLPLGLTLFLFYAASVAANFVYGSFFLHEKITNIKIVSLLLAFLGLLFIYAGSFGQIKLIPSLFALVSGTCFGLNTSTSKKLTGKYSIIQVNLVNYLVAFFLSLILLFFTNEPVNFFLPTNIWLTLIAFAIVSVITLYLTLYGFQKIEAQKGGLIMLCELIFVVVVGIILYKEIPTINVIIGGICIVTALALPNITIASGNRSSPRPQRNNQE